MSLTTFQNEKIILKHNGETLVEVDDARPANKGKRMVVAVTRDRLRTDYPVFYGKIVTWDNPEWFSKGFKLRVSKYSQKERENIKQEGLKIQGAIEFND